MLPSFIATAPKSFNKYCLLVVLCYQTEKLCYMHVVLAACCSTNIFQYFDFMQKLLSKYEKPANWMQNTIMWSQTKRANNVA